MSIEREMGRVVKVTAGVLDKLKTVKILRGNGESLGAVVGNLVDQEIARLLQLKIGSSDE